MGSFNSPKAFNRMPRINLLAKSQNMYYPIRRNRNIVAYRHFSALLILSISLITYPAVVSADIKSKTAEEYRIQGQAEQRKGNLEDALKLYRKSLNLNPEQSAVLKLISSLAEEYRIRAYREQQKGNFNNALRFYLEALSLAPQNPVVFNDMAVLYEQVGVLDKAEELYLRAVAVDESYLPPYMNLAYLYQKKGELVKAAEYFRQRYERAGSHDPWGKMAQRELFKVDPNYQERLIEQELAKLSRQFIEKTRDEFYKQIVKADGHYQAGMDLLAQEAYDGAVEEFDRALLLTPRNPKVIRAREQALLEKRREEIRNRSAQAIEMLNAGDTDTAEEEYRKILSIISSESE